MVVVEQEPICDVSNICFSREKISQIDGQTTAAQTI